MAGWPAKKAAAFNLTFPIFDADGDLVAGAAGLDSEVSKDGGTFTDCTNEAAEIATSSGMYKLVLTSTEMNADEVAVITKTSTTGAKTAPNVIYTSVRQIDDVAFPATSGRSLAVETDGMVHADVKEWKGAAPNDLVSSRVDVSVGAMAANVLTATAIAADALTAAKIASDVSDEIAAKILSNPANLLVTDASGRVTIGALADAVITAAKFAAGAIDANALAADAVDEIWDEATSGHTTAGTFGNVLRLHGLGMFIQGQVNDAGPTTMDFDTSGFTEASNDHFNQHWVVFITGALKGQARMIRDYVGTGQNMQFDRPFTEAPGNGDQFLILGTQSGAAEFLMSRLADVEADADTSVRRVLWAIAKLVNKVDASTTSVAVKKTDDATNQFTQTATEDAGANPITILDTV
jgi:hypothetical protein